MLLLATTAWGQQLNFSPIQSLAQHQVTSSQDTKRNGNEKQQFRFLTLPIEQNQLSSREMNLVGSVQIFQHARENNGVVQQRFQQPQHLKAHRATASPTTPRNSLNVPVPHTLEHPSAAEQHSIQQSQSLQKIPVQTQVFKPLNHASQILSFQTSQQSFQPLPSPSAQQQIPFSIQKPENRASQAQPPQKKVGQNQERVGVTTLSPEELFQKQARNAKYSFKSAINDNIMDNTQIRQEKRNGLELSGFYSYSDGFYKRTVHYKADEHGYRVTK